MWDAAVVLVEDDVVVLVVWMIAWFASKKDSTRSSNVGLCPVILGLVMVDVLVTDSRCSRSGVDGVDGVLGVLGEDVWLSVAVSCILDLATAASRSFLNAPSN